MATAYVLHLADACVGPALQSIRVLCQPYSTSRPHITVRYPVNKLRQNDLSLDREVPVPFIDIVGPGIFVNETDNGKRYSVYLQCASETLEQLSYKPDYPDSVFHITLYDGYDESRARSLLDLLADFEWNRRVSLPGNTRVSEVPVGGRRKVPDTIDLPVRVAERLAVLGISGEKREAVESIPFEVRLRLIRRICKEIVMSTVPATGDVDGGAARELIPSVRPGGQLILSGAAGEPMAFDEDEKRRRAKYGSVEATGGDNRGGVYLTPPELARSVVAVALEELGSAEIHFGDPAVGPGAFFAALTLASPGQGVSSAIGIEINAGRAALTQSRWGKRGLVVLTGDYLHMEDLPPRSLILANPPYVRYQHIDKALATRWRRRVHQRLGLDVSGQAGLYVYFMLLSADWMAANAVAAWLVPSEFMDANYGAVLRDYLSRFVTLLRVHRFSLSSVQFEDALVSSAVVFYRNAPPPRDHMVRFTDGGSLGRPNSSRSISVVELSGNVKWKMGVPRLAEKSALTVGDLFDVKRGIATGANRFFVLRLDEALAMGLPRSELKPLLPKMRTLAGDIVRRDPADGYPMVANKLCVIDSHRPESEIQERFPRLWAYLMTAPSSVRNASLVASRRPWYRQESREPAPFLCSYMGRGGAGQKAIRFILNESDAIAVNTYLLLYPKHFLRKELKAAPNRMIEVLRMLQEIGSATIEAAGRVYAGGLQKLEPGELRRLPIESPPPWITDALVTT